VPFSLVSPALGLSILAPMVSRTTGLLVVLADQPPPCFQTQMEATQILPVKHKNSADDRAAYLYSCLCRTCSSLKLHKSNPEPDDQQSFAP